MCRYVPALMALLLTACAATPYQASDPHGYGYQEQRLTDGLYDVMFVGNTATSEQQVADLALLHAAELGAAQGYAYLAVSDRKGGVITLAGRNGPATPGLPMPNARDAGMSMGMGGSGGYGNTATTPQSYTVNSSGGGGNPARACVLRVRFYKQGEHAPDASVQDVQVLLTRLRGEYGVSAAGH